MGFRFKFWLRSLPDYTHEALVPVFPLRKKFLLAQNARRPDSGTRLTKARHHP